MLTSLSLICGIRPMINIIKLNVFTWAGSPIMGSGNDEVQVGYGVVQVLSVQLESPKGILLQSYSRSSLSSFSDKNTSSASGSGSLGGCISSIYSISSVINSSTSSKLSTLTSNPSSSSSMSDKSLDNKKFAISSSPSDLIWDHDVLSNTFRLQRIISSVNGFVYENLLRNVD
ncbi:hypothetical protein QTP88_015180 [Uroleucon formosanum]